MENKVLIFIDDLKDGGAQKVFAVLASELANNNVDVTLVCLKGGAAQSFLNERVKLITLGSNRVAKAFFELNRVIGENEPDVILTGLLHNNIFLILLKMVFFKKTRLIVSEHSIPSKIPFKSLSLTNKVCSLLRPLLYRFASSVIAVSQSCKEDLVEYCNIKASNIEVIYNPININHQLYGVKNIRKEKYFIAVGRLHPVKNFSQLIKSFSASEKSNTHKLFILGDGPERKNLQRIIDDLKMEGSISLMGYIPEPMDMISKAQALVVTSDYEGFGNVVVESFSCGTPVISTPCLGPEEIINSPEVGVVINSICSLTETLNNFGLFNFKQEALYDRACFFAPEKIAVEYLKMMGDL